MKSLTLLLTITSIALADEPSSSFSDGNRLFTADVYRELSKDQSGNFLFSPFSTEIILALTAIGARNITSQELIKGVRLPSTEEQISIAVKSILSGLRNEETSEWFQLNSANKVYINDKFDVNNEFKETATDVFEAGVEDINCSDNVGSANKINNWVASKTNNKITDLVGEKEIDEDTKLILVNALYFSGKWANMFRVADTNKTAFYKNGIDEVQVDTMHVSGEFNYHEDTDLDAKFVELPYIGGNASLTIVLPNKRDGYIGIEKEIECVFNKEHEFNYEYISLSVPKFHFRSQIKFVPILKNLGIKTAFSDDADFTGISKAGGLYVSNIIQKTYINVTEAGTEAAAATAEFVVTRLGAVSDTLINVAVDHPFIFYIKYSENIIFAGRITDP